MIEQRAHFHLSELFSEDVMYKRDGERSPTTDATRFTLLLSPHSQSWNKSTSVILVGGVGEDFERSSRTDVLRLRELHGLPRLALCPDQALDPYWGNPSTTHTLLAD